MHTLYRPLYNQKNWNAQVGLMLTGMVVDNVVFGTPAYNSQVCVY
jgi:hypothetical protein